MWQRLSQTWCKVCPFKVYIAKNWVYFSFCKRFNVFLRRMSSNKLLGLVLLSRFNFWMVISLVLVHLDILFGDVFLLLSNFLFPCKPFILCNVKKKSVLLPFFFQYQFPVVYKPFISIFRTEAVMWLVYILYDTVAFWAFQHRYFQSEWSCERCVLLYTT